MNEECFHSYCKECIEKSASTFLLCPICNSSLPSSLSSLPINYTLLYWQSLSLPPTSQIFNQFNNNNKKNNHNNNNNNNEEKNKEKINKEMKEKCEDCDENSAEFRCSDCKTILCSTCSNTIHSRRSMKNHSIIPFTSSNKSSNNFSNNSLPLSSPIIQFYECKFHNQRKMELYCMTCNECVCVDCTGHFHYNHANTSVIKQVEAIKEEWKKRIKEISIEIIDNHFNLIDIKYKKFKFDIDKVEEEINIWEEKLKNLKEKKEKMIEEMEMIKDCKEKINQTKNFLYSFIQSLPSLPLSSFLPSNINNINNNNNKNNNNNNNNNNENNINKDNINIKNNNKEKNDNNNNNNNNNNNDNNNYINKEEKGSMRIKDFFEKENLTSLFSTLLSSLPSSSSSPSLSPPFPPTNPDNFTETKIPPIKNTNEENEKKNKFFFSNLLIQNENLLSHFGSQGSNLNQFNGPYYITFNNKLNLIGISDCYNNIVKITNKNGMLIKSFPVLCPTGITIIPSFQLLAVSSSGKQLIEIFDISSLYPYSSSNYNNNNNKNNNNQNNNNNNNNNNDNKYKDKDKFDFNPEHKNNNSSHVNDPSHPLPLLYTIGKGRGGREDHFHLNNPRGIAYSEGKGILAISDHSNKRIEYIK